MPKQLEVDLPYWVTRAKAVYPLGMEKKQGNKAEAAAQNETNQFLKVHQQALERRRKLNQQASARREKAETELELPRDREDEAI